MGRMMPSPLEVGSSFIYPAVSLTLLAAWIAATVAIIAALCGAKSRKSSPQHPPSISSSPKTEDDTNNHVVTTTTTTTTTTRTSTAAEPSQPVPLQTTTTETMVATSTGAQENSKEGPSSPIQQEQKHRRSATNIPKNNSVVSTGKLIKSLSMKIPGSGAMARLKARKEEYQQQKEGQKKGEESIWTKTIILGEKCRVPDEEDAIIYDEKGQRISAYPTRTPRSLPVSRTNSFFNPDGNPSWRR